MGRTFWCPSLTYERKEGLLRQGETGPTKSHYHSNACGWKKTMEKSTLDDCIVVVSFAELWWTVWYCQSRASWKIGKRSPWHWIRNMREVCMYIVLYIYRVVLHLSLFYWTKSCAHPNCTREKTRLELLNAKNIYRSVRKLPK